MLPDLKDTSLLWMSPLRKSAFYIYWILLILFLLGFLSLFFIRVSISVTAPGIVIVGPDKNLLAECHVGAKDISQLEPGKKVKIHLDAFGDSQYGSVTGNIYAIKNSFEFVGEKPIIKVTCRMDQRDILIDKSIRCELKRDMNVQATFITGSQTLWQLLFDTIENRLSPV